MKKILIFMGALFLILIVVAIVGIIFANIKGTALDKESKQYVDDAIVHIVSDWDKQEFIKRISPEFKRDVNDEDVNKHFAWCSKLGKLKEYKGSEGQSHISLTTENGKVITAKYTAKAEFEAGPADINVTIIKHGNEWQILKWNVDSNAISE